MKRSNKKTLSSYEEDLIYMSSRYCIGRNNISCNMYPYEILKNSYNKMSDSFKEKYAKDIRKEILNTLQYFGYNISNLCKENNCELSSYINFLKGNNCDNVKFVTYLGDNQWSIDVKEDGYKFDNLVPIANLIVWNEFANFLDKNSHIVVNNIEYIESYVYYYQNKKFSKVYIAVDDYANNPIACNKGVDLAI